MSTYPCAGPVLSYNGKQEWLPMTLSPVQEMFEETALGYIPWWTFLWKYIYVGPGRFDI